MSISLTGRVPPLSRNVKGSLFMVVAMASFTVNDALVKLATEELETGQIILIRGAMASLLLFFIAHLRGAIVPLREALRPLLLARALADVLATVAFITALSQMPLANVSAILQALPLAATIGAALFLREAVGWRRWTAIFVGFLGVLVIIRPGTDGFTAASGLVLVAVVGAATRDLTTRRLPATMPTLFISATTALASTLCGAMLVPFSGWDPVSPGTFGLLVLATFALAAGQVFIVTAVRVGDMGFIAPFRYSVLIFAFVLSAAVFGEVPGPFEFAGSAIIAASGLYMVLRERRRGFITVPSKQVH